MTRETVLQNLLRSMFTAGELRRWLADGSEDLRRVAVAIPAAGEGTDLPMDALVHEVVGAMGRQGVVDGAFFQALVKSFPRREGEIWAVARLWDKPPGGSDRVTALTRRSVGCSLVITIGATSVLAAIWGEIRLRLPDPPPLPTPVESIVPPPEPPMAPAAKGPLNLVIVYLDPPSVIHPVDRVQALAVGLREVLAADPRAVLLARALPEGTDAGPVVAALAGRAAMDPPVIALLPDVEGKVLPPLSQDVAQPYRSGISVCDGREKVPGACVGLQILAPPGALDPAWASSQESGPVARKDPPLDRLSRCEGTAPFASLALALLARSGRAVVENHGAALKLACQEGATRAFRAPATAICDRPYAWVWASELHRGVLERSHDPLGAVDNGTCSGWQRFMKKGGLKNQTVVLADPYSAGGARAVSLVAGREQGETVTLSVTETEAMAIAAWNTLGWLEEGP